MKKFFLSALCAFIGTVAMAQATISGTVTDNAALPVANHMVFAEDSFASQWSDSALTDAAGNYTMTIPAWVTYCSMRVYTDENCAPWTLQNGYYYTGNNITSDFVLCANVLPPATISGQVTDVNPAYGDSAAIVYLIDQTYDSVAMTYILTAKDSAATDMFGNYSINVPVTYSTLLVKAAEQSFSPEYANYLPTYYTSSLSWSGATSVAPNATANIQLIAGTNPGGPAFIGGDVLQGANKSTAVGDPLNKRILILTTGANVPVAYAYSNASGHFSFPSVPYGAYKIFGDAPGKSNPAFSFTLDAAHPSISNIEFQEHAHLFEGHIATAVVNVNGKLSGISLYPNPAVDNVNVLGLETVSGAKTITLSSMNGATVYTHTFNDGEKTVVPVNGLSKGVYMLNINTTDGVATFKLTK